MAGRKDSSDPFVPLGWDDLEEWAGSKIVSRGRTYQRQGLVSELALTDDGALIGWVRGTHRYATKIVMGEDGVPESVCTCPYGSNCKHGVAVVLEYLAQVEANRRVPTADEDDERLALLESEEWDEDAQEWDEVSYGDRAGLSASRKGQIEGLLQDKDRDQLVELILELAEQYPGIAQDLADREQMISGSTKPLVARLRKEIRDIAEWSGPRDYWEDEEYATDFSGIRKKLDALLKGGHADEVLDLGKELVISGTRQAEESDDEGWSGEEVAECMSVVAKALDQSSLTPAERLAWAVDAVLKDQYDLCTALKEYLDRRHPKAAWNALADQLLGRLKALKPSTNTDSFSQHYARNQLGDWAIHALEQAGRTDEIIPLCEAEAPKTNSYDRLVDWLIAKRRYEDAERWIREGIRATNRKWDGVSDALRERFKGLRTRRKDWPVVAAMEVEEFVHYPSLEAFTSCEKVCRKIDAWSKVREALLAYLECGELPWSRKGWPLPATGLDALKPSHRESFPMFDVLIDIAIAEKDPERVLHWYDRRPKKGPGWFTLDEDRVASAVETHAPDRAIAIWKSMAERLIAQTKPSAYEEAARYLRKAGAVMTREGRQQQWTQYLRDLRETHARKRRFMEVLDTLSRVRKPIVTKKH